MLANSDGAVVRVNDGVPGRSLGITAGIGGHLLLVGMNRYEPSEPTL